MESGSLPLAAERDTRVWKIWLALLAVYVIWGSTYLAIRVAVETFPPFMMTSIRYFFAGGALLLFLLLRGAPLPSRVEWRNGLLTGGLMLGVGTGGIAFAEQQGVASGLAALAVAAVPLWASLFAGLWGHWPSKREWGGVLIGLIGVAILNMEHSMQSTPIGALAAIVGPMGWALGSIWGRQLKLPGGLMTTAVQMMGGCLTLAVITVLFGERLTAMPSGPSILALVYLVTFGALVAFSAYTYLLEHVRPALATSYAYVNPLVAVFLGVLLANEQMTLYGMVAMGVILAGVALLALGKTRAH
ncbi:MAG: drug/metabolite exporter YedA [Chloroflexi bacterium]|nr:drug/metabolite exporter YedA [Chloroflexota bacterium]